MKDCQFKNKKQKTKKPALKESLNFQIQVSTFAGSPSDWQHTNLKLIDSKPHSVIKLNQLAEHFYNQFLPFFTNQVEGSIKSRAKVEFSGKMERKLGLSYLFERVIRLNRRYFEINPNLLPYTLFHEMTHLWLYDCNFDPKHTQRFYNKMEEFSISGLPTDPQVHIHTRIAKEANYVYSCPNCRNRWYLKRELCYPLYCGFCYDIDGIEYFATFKKN